MLCGIYKLPNISIRYTGTWKDSLKFGVGMATTAAGIILALLGGGSEILTGGVSTAISVPAAASGIAIAGTGLAISGSALANMFDVRIQKSESSKGNGDGVGAKNTEQYLRKAEEFAKAKRPAYKLTIDFGKEIGIKKSSAQITEQYKLEELVGQQILAVVNFPPRQIADFMSEVLVLGTYSENGVVLITPQKKVANGDKLG